MAQAQAGADFGIAGAIAGATAGKAGAAAGSIYSAAVSKAAGDLTRSLNAVQTGFVDAATAASVKATKAIAAAETVERKAVAKADVVLAQDLQSAWGTYAAAERSAVTLNARERATIGADYKKEVAGAELAAVKAVAPARKTSMVAAAEANGVYHVKVTGIIADLGILGGEIKVEQVKASHSLISPATLKKWLDLLSTCGDVAAAIGKGLAQGAANSLNGAQDNFAHTGNLFLTYVNTVADVTDAFVGTPKDQRIRVPMIPLVDWSRGRFVAETDSDHSTSKTAGGFGLGVLGPMGYARLAALRNVAVVDDVVGAGNNLLAGKCGFTIADASPLARRVDVLPHNPLDTAGNWGLRSEHLIKHFFGSGKVALRQIDPGGNPDSWMGYISRLFARPETARTANGMIDIMGDFPRADGSGTFRLGIRLFHRADGLYELITILTRQ